MESQLLGRSSACGSGAAYPRSSHGALGLPASPLAVVATARPPSRASSAVRGSSFQRPSPLLDSRRCLCTSRRVSSPLRATSRRAGHPSQLPPVARATRTACRSGAGVAASFLGATLSSRQNPHPDHRITQITSAAPPSGMANHRRSGCRTVTVAVSSSSAGRGPVNITETDRLAGKVRDSVLAAVEGLGGRVTVGDVAARAGLKVTEAETALKALIADANGFLEVSDEGDVLYVFPRDMRAVLAQRSLRVRLAPLLKKAQDVGSYVIRVTFGSALLVSVVVVYTAIAALLSSSSRSDNDRGDRGGYRASYGGPSFYINLSDFFWYWDPFYYQNLRARLLTREMSFVESVFSFVFGDGDPNEGLDETRWQAVGELISSKGGVVAAQEVAPFLDIPRDFLDDESYMLPVVQRFDGIPEVDAQGNILYRFPSLQRTAQDWRGRPKVLVGDAALGRSGGAFQTSGSTSTRGSTSSSSFLGQMQQQASSSLLFFSKNLFKFSSAPPYKQALAAGLGVLNLVGVAYLSFLVRDPVIIRQAGSELLSGVNALLPFLQAYATAFFAIPAVRWLMLQQRNDKITEENQRREESALLLSRPSAQLRRKLANAREQAEKVVLDQDRVIYTTAQDLADQDFERREWERKLEERR